jgi:DNA helicase-2/ATP-dependent DNA helicase PcrA
MLFEILHFDWFGIVPIEIAKLSMEVADKKYTGTATSIRQLLTEKVNAPSKDLFSSNITEGLKNASVVLEKLLADVPNTTLQQLFENIIRGAGVLSHIMLSPDKHWDLQVLSGLFDFVKEETQRNPSLDLKGLVSLVELMEREGIPLPLVQVSGSDKGVNLLTAHGSKGLEFEYVLLVGCTSSLWEKKRKPSIGYKMPDTIFSSNLPPMRKRSCAGCFT